MRLLRHLTSYRFTTNTSYEPLDTSLELPRSSSRRRSASFGQRSRSRTHHVAAITLVPLVVITAGFIFYHFIFRFAVIDEFVFGYPDVPEYDEYVAWEERFPQHNATLDYPEGLNGRYVMFANQATGYGLNNMLQESLLLSHLSYLSRRAYVFQPYVWDADAKSNAVREGKSWRSSRIPLSVFVAGPTAGGAFAAGDPSPRAVNVGWWEKVCPPARRVQVDVGSEHAAWGVSSTTEGKEMVQLWSKKLTALQDTCVEVIGDIIFDFGFIASPRVLSVWPSFSNSPILTRFAWSNLIDGAVARNLHRFYTPAPPPLPDNSPPRLPDEPREVPPPSLPVIPESTADSPLPFKAYPRAPPTRNRRPPSPSLSSLSLQSSSYDVPSLSSNTSQTIKGLIAVHLRRGDFKMHCHWLADRSEPFAGWNQFPYLLDRFTPPTLPGEEKSLDLLGRAKKHLAYMERCWPEIDAIVMRLREIRRLHPGLERVFVLTNGKREWVEGLKRALVSNGEDIDVDVGGEEEEGWKNMPLPVKLPGAMRVKPVPPPSTSGSKPWREVLTSKDLSLLWTEREVDQAVDMEIARRAEVFLGNGFSSLTSNIIMLRLSDGTPIENNRFW